MPRPNSCSRPLGAGHLPMRATPVADLARVLLRRRSIRSSSGSARPATRPGPGSYAPGRREWSTATCLIGPSSVASTAAHSVPTPPRLPRHGRSRHQVVLPLCRGRLIAHAGRAAGAGRGRPQRLPVASAVARPPCLRHGPVPTTGGPRIDAAPAAWLSDYARAWDARPRRFSLPILSDLGKIRLPRFPF